MVAPKLLRILRFLLWWSAVVLIYLMATSWLSGREHAKMQMRPDVIIPLPGHLAMMGGDKYLGANLNYFRALMSDIDHQPPSTYRALAQLHLQAAYLNPQHQDNYNLAATLLPWEGELDAAQQVLDLAIKSRPQDYYPVFMYAFHQYYFLRDGTGAAKTLLQGAESQPDVDTKITLQNFAAKWAEATDNPKAIVGVLKALIARTESPEFKDYLARRLVRIQNLDILRQSAAIFKARTGRQLVNLDELIHAGLIDSIPVDPFRVGYGLDDKGVPVFNTPSKRGR